MNEATTLSTPPRDPLMKPSPVAAAAATDSSLFSGIMNVQTASGSGSHAAESTDTEVTARNAEQD